MHWIMHIPFALGLLKKLGRGVTYRLVWGQRFLQLIDRRASTVMGLVVVLESES